MSRSERQLKTRIRNTETLLSLELKTSEKTEKNKKGILREVNRKLDRLKYRIEKMSSDEQISDLFTELKELNKLSAYTDPTC